MHCRSPKVPKSACLPSAVGADAGRPPPLLDTAVSAVRPGPKDHYETREKRESRAGSTSRLRRSGDKAAVHCRTPNVLARGSGVRAPRLQFHEIPDGLPVLIICAALWGHGAWTIEKGGTACRCPSGEGGRNQPRMARISRMPTT